MVTEIQLGDIRVDVTLKSIKNVHLSVHPPDGAVTISAPNRMNIENIRAFAISKLGWIKQQQKKLREQARETQREFIDGESHYVWGTRYLLKVVEDNRAACVEIDHNRLFMTVRPGTDTERRRVIMEDWYREQVKAVVPELIAKWEPQMGVKVARFYVQRMKTRWGTCTGHKGHIRINTELARKPRECLEYVVIHEMAHLQEPSHGPRFVALMDRFSPGWKHLRRRLNAKPLPHADWEY